MCPTVYVATRCKQPREMQLEKKENLHQASYKNSAKNRKILLTFG